MALMAESAGASLDLGAMESRHEPRFTRKVLEARSSGAASTLDLLEHWAREAGIEPVSVQISLGVQSTGAILVSKATGVSLALEWTWILGLWLSDW
jgi:hypothetical protein